MKKRSVKIAGHPTSISLEEPFWDALRELAGEEGKSLSQLIAEIDTARDERNLSSALRVWVLQKVLGKLPPVTG